MKPQEILDLALKSAERLVDHHAGMRQTVTFSLCAAGQQHGTHAGSLADAHGADIGLDELHGVIDGQTRGH